MHLFPSSSQPASRSTIRLGSPHCLAGLRRSISWCVSTLCEQPFREMSRAEFGNDLFRTPAVAARALYTSHDHYLVTFADNSSVWVCDPVMASASGVGHC
eukprot:3032309-Prymnesium_polylepis.1